MIYLKGEEVSPFRNAGELLHTGGGDQGTKRWNRETHTYTTIARCFDGLLFCPGLSCQVDVHIPSFH